MRALELARGVYWVGAIDWNLRDFHGYETPRGSTYNAYLVVDDKIALIDTVKAHLMPEMLRRIETVVDPSKIDYVISNHTEMDHSGGIPSMMQIAKNAKLITSKKAGEQALAHTYHTDWPLMPVAEGDKLDLGKRTLQFVPIPMLHWPDSMMTYLVEDQILFPNDAFGQHYGGSEMFDDLADIDEVMQAAKMYYATILMPFGQLIVRAVDKLKGIPFKIIAPSHGVIWRGNPNRIVDAYAAWGRGEVKRKAVIAYDTMWGSTEKMAKALADGIASRDVEVRLFDLKASQVAHIIKEILDAKALIVGSATINNGMLFPPAGFLNLLKGYKPKGKIGMAFGSYGWGGGAVKAIESELQAAGVELVEPGLSINFVPDAEALANCLAVGQRIGDQI